MMALLMLPACAIVLALSVALLMQLAGALVLALLMAHAASLRSPLLTALRCCKLALLSVVGGATDGMACY